MIPFFNFCKKRTQLASVNKHNALISLVELTLNSDENITICWIAKTIVSNASIKSFIFYASYSQWKGD